MAKDKKQDENEAGKYGGFKGWVEDKPANKINDTNQSH
jgi:hypothetical protein